MIIIYQIIAITITYLTTRIMAFGLDDFATVAGIGEGLANTAGNLFGIGQKRQIRQQKKLTAIQVGAQKELGAYNKQLALDMWNDTNYEAQMKHLEGAGLNPALLYGKSGGGGATASVSPGSVSGGQASSEYHSNGSMGIQMAMAAKQTQANIELTEAQKRNVDADTKLKENEQPENIRQNTAESAARTSHEQAKQRITEAMAKVANDTVETQIATANAEKDKIEGEARSAKANGEIDEATMNNRVDAANLANIETQTRLAAIRAGIENTRVDSAEGRQAIQKMSAEILKMGRDYQQRGIEIDQREEEIAIKKLLAEFQREYKDFDTSQLNKMQSILGDILKSASHIRK